MGFEGGGIGRKRLVANYGQLPKSRDRSTMWTILPYMFGCMTFRLLEMYSSNSWSVDRLISLLLISMEGSRKSKMTLHCSSF